MGRVRVNLLNPHNLPNLLNGIDDRLAYLNSFKQFSQYFGTYNGLCYMNLAVACLGHFFGLHLNSKIALILEMNCVWAKILLVGSVEGIAPR